MRSLFALIIGLFTWHAQAELSVYTDRPVERMMEVAQRYEKITGVKVAILSNGFALLKQRLDLEYQNPDLVPHPADVIMVKDLVNLGEVVENGWFAPMSASAVLAEVPENLRDPKNLWVSITSRARTLIYDANSDVSSINTYEDLADPKWAGTLCLTSSSSSYNEGLVAELISHYGLEKTTAIVKGLVANQSIPPQDQDIAVIRSLDNGDCSLALINSYNLGFEVYQNPSYAGRIKFLNQQDDGVMMNAGGAGVGVNSLNPVEAQKFVEFMLSEDIQKYLSEQELSFPASVSVPPPPVVAAWGDFIVNPVNLSDVSKNIEQARAIMLEANWK
jgi:iron(III) transport system substrate-binding protein